MRLFVALCATAFVLLVAGCTRPPECASPETIALARTIFTNEIKKQLEPFAKIAELNASVGAFMNVLKIDVTQVVNDGYNSEAKKQSCKAHFTITNTSTYPKDVLVLYQNAMKELAVDSHYTLQMTVDKSDQYRMEIERAQPLAEAAATWFQYHTSLKAAEKAMAQAPIKPPEPIVAAPEAGTANPSTASGYYTAAVNATAKSNAGLPEFKHLEAYSSVRDKMLGAGWAPFHASNADDCEKDDLRCAGRPEMVSCAGSGLANCKFAWKLDAKIIGICTVGEERAMFESMCSYP